MPLYRTLVTLPWSTGLPEDVTVNTYHFVADDVTALGIAHTNLRDLYQAIDINMALIATGSNACDITSYDMDDDEPRAPVLETLFTMTSASNPMPTDVALVVSFQGTKISGTSQARRRGRVFLGPMAQGALDSSTGRPDTTDVSQIVASFDTFLTASKTGTTWNWVIWSPTSQLSVAVDNGWVDNEWDTQRRRGRRATTRSTFS